MMQHSRLDTIMVGCAGADNRHEPMDEIPGDCPSWATAIAAIFSWSPWINQPSNIGKDLIHCRWAFQ